MCKKNSKKSWNLLSGSQRKSSRQTRGNLLIPLLWGLGLKNLSIYQILHFYNYLVGKDDYSVENLRTFKTCKRLLECKFFHDGHVEDLQCCPLVNKAFSLFLYESKPTVPTKNRRWNVNLQWLFILKSSVEVHAAFFRVKEVAMALANKSLMQF